MNCISKYVQVKISVLCDYGFSVSAVWCPLATPTISLGFLLPWTWGISSQLLQQSMATAPYLGWGHPSWPWTWSSCSLPSCAHAATSPWTWGCSSQPPLLDHRKSKTVPEKHLFLLYWPCQNLWLCGSQLTVENSERDGHIRPPDLPLEKPICRSGSNS